MVRENWVITVKGELILKAIWEKKIWAKRAVLNLSRFSGNDDRLTGNTWMMDFPSQFVTWIIGFKQYAVRIL